MRRKTETSPQKNVWIKRFAWIPRVIRTNNNKTEYVWLERYEELIGIDGTRKLVRRLRDELE